MKREYPWYGIAEESDDLEQGDFIDNCKVVIPTYIPVEIGTTMPTNPQEQFDVAAIVEIRDVIIMTQSCDLENTKVEYVKLSPRISLSEYIELKQNSGQSLKQIAGTLNDIRLGRKYRFHMLQQCNLPELYRQIQIVDLGTSYSVPCDVLKDLMKSSGSRIRLLSPYKEQLAQAFGYFYMRVAQPNSIEELKLDYLKSLSASAHVVAIPQHKE